MTTTTTEVIAPSTGAWRAVRAFFRNPAAVAATAFLAFVTIVALTAPLIYPEDPLSMVARPFLWPGQNPKFLLGSDSLGRDVAAGLVWGSRISLVIGISAMALGVTIGIVVEIGRAHV